MDNPNTKQVLTLEEKRSAGGIPAVIKDYSGFDGQFAIVPDERYKEEGQPTDYIDFDPTFIDAILIGAFATGTGCEPEGYVGRRIIIPMG